MKAIKSGIILMVLSFSFLTSFGQSEIFGHWKVSCYLERNQDGGLCMCGICPTTLANNQLEIMDFEFEINGQTLGIIVNGKITNVPYTWDSKMDAMSFEFEKSKYSFKVLKGTHQSNYILKDSKCGGLLFMTKI